MGSERRWRELPIAGYGTTTVGPINHLRSGMLSYVTPEWVHAMRPMNVIMDPPIILCSQECSDVVADRGGIPSNSSDPAGDFWAAVNSAAPGSLWAPESDNKIAASAVVHPYAQVGVPAFKVFRGKLCPSFGGVVIGEHSSVGANTCIARGIFGEYTEIGDNVHIDNLVHVGHSAIIGSGTTIAANSTVGGWAEIGDGCRIETSVTVFQSVKIGAGTRVGAHSVVTKDLPPGVVAFGNPARVVQRDKKPRKDEDAGNPSGDKDRERPAQWYDEAYARNPATYRGEARGLPFAEHVWLPALSMCRGRVLDVGCGPGHFAELCRPAGVNYVKGVDFSTVAIEKARERCPWATFEVGDAGEAVASEEYDTVTMLEMLEHVYHDIAIIKAVPPGKRIVFSVPSFETESHCRWFKGINQVRRRYGKLIDIDKEHVSRSMNGQRRWYVVCGTRKG